VVLGNHCEEGAPGTVDTEVGVKVEDANQVVDLSEGGGGGSEGLVARSGSRTTLMDNTSAYRKVPKKCAEPVALQEALPFLFSRAREVPCEGEVSPERKQVLKVRAKGAHVRG
jgi:hypothetical protein